MLTSASQKAVVCPVIPWSLQLGLGSLLLASAGSAEDRGVPAQRYVVRQQIEVWAAAPERRGPPLVAYTYDRVEAPVTAHVPEDGRTRRIREALEESPDHLQRLLIRSGRVVHVIGRRAPPGDPNERWVNGGLWGRWYQAPLRLFGSPSGVSLPKGDIYVRRGPRLRLPAAASFVLPVAVPGDFTARHEVGHAVTHLFLLSYSRELLDLCGLYRGVVNTIPVVMGKYDPCGEFAAEMYRQFWQSPKSRSKLPIEVQRWVRRFEWDAYTGKYDGVAIAQSLQSRKDARVGKRLVPGNERLKYAYRLGMRQFPWSELDQLQRLGARFLNFYDMTFRAWQSRDDFEEHGSLVPRLEAIIAASSDEFPTRRQDVHIQVLCGPDMRWHPFNYLIYGSRANDQGQAGCVYLWGPTPETLGRQVREQALQPGMEHLAQLVDYPWPRVDKNDDIRPVIGGETLHYIPEPLSRQRMRSIVKAARQARRRARRESGGAAGDLRPLFTLAGPRSGRPGRRAGQEGSWPARRR